MSVSSAKRYPSYRSVLHEGFSKAKLTITKFVSQNAVLVIALTLAIISCFIVKPDSKYIEYFDFKTLTCLFCTLAVICALKNIRFFTITAKKS